MSFRFRVKQYHVYATGISNMEDKKCWRSEFVNDDDCIFKYSYLACLRNREGVATGNYLQWYNLFPLSPADIL